jgi:hypothetical protein
MGGICTKGNIIYPKEFCYMNEYFYTVNWEKWRNYKMLEDYQKDSDVTYISKDFISKGSKTGVIEAENANSAMSKLYKMYANTKINYYERGTSMGRPVNYIGFETCTYTVKDLHKV